ncbi:MAG: DUF1828 domain-containing protein [Candidatus Competibacter sp.]
MHLDLYQDFQTRPTAGGFLIVTPLRHDDQDAIVVYGDRQPDGRWCVHDNGDAALRLMFDSVDLDTPKIQTWLKEQTARVKWNDALAQLECPNVAESNLTVAVFQVAQAAAQLQAMTALRQSREESRFKDEVIGVLKQVEQETGITACYDVPFDPERLFVADCLFIVKQPVAILIASTTERLLEAELAWSHLRRLSDPTLVVAVIEDAAQVGKKQAARANYFTDKVYPYRDFETIFRDAIMQTLQPRASVPMH